jgi:hypothetical protein
MPYTNGNTTTPADWSGAFFKPDIEKLIKKYSGKGGRRKLAGAIALNAFVYRRYPYPAGSRAKEFIRRGRKGKTHRTMADDPKPKTRHTRQDMIDLKAVQRVKVRLALTEDGTIWARVDMFLDRQKAFGWLEWKGGWHFVTGVNLNDQRFTIEGQAEVWHQLGFMVRGTGVSQTTLNFFQGLRMLKE